MWIAKFVAMAAVFFCTRNAVAGFVNFDDFNAGGSIGFAAADRYRPQGIVFHRTIPIEDVAAVEPEFYPTFVAQGGTPPNFMPLASSLGLLSIEASFVLPGTSTSATTDRVRALFFDTEEFTLLGTLEAFDINGTLIASATRITPPFQKSGFLEVTALGIARVRLSTDADGAGVDNLFFNTPVAAAVPEPSAVTIAALGALALIFQRRFAHRHATNSRGFACGSAIR